MGARFSQSLALAGSRQRQAAPDVVQGDLGSGLTLQCNVASGRRWPRRVLWQKDGRGLGSGLSWTLHEPRGALVSTALLESDAGDYSCGLDDGRAWPSTRLVIRSQGPPLIPHRALAKARAIAPLSPLSLVSSY